MRIHKVNVDIGIRILVCLCVFTHLLLFPVVFQEEVWEVTAQLVGLGIGILIMVHT